MLAVAAARSSKSRQASRIASDARRDALRVERFADHHGAAAAVEDHAGLEVVGAEVDERADGARLADDVGDGQLVEPVLRRDHAAGGGQMGEQRAGGGRRCGAPWWRG